MLIIGLENTIIYSLQITRTMVRENVKKEYHTASKGELTKINLEGYKECGKVYVSDYNAVRLQKLPG
jgi:hypothetical protein